MLDHLSAEACFARRGAGGGQLIEATGFIGAAFRHRTSRAGDPQLHTHVVVPNLVQGADGRWSAPDGRHLYTWKKTAGTLYQSALRAELRPLGLAWQVRRNGLGELRDIPEDRSCGHSRSGGRTSRRRWSSGGDLGQSGRERRAGHSEAEARLGARRRRRCDEGWTEQLAAIELPDGEVGTRPATCRRPHRCPRQRTGRSARTRRHRGNPSGPGGRERCVAR